jgi:hypothetical protein
MLLQTVQKVNTLMVFQGPLLACPADGFGAQKMARRVACGVEKMYPAIMHFFRMKKLYTGL